MKTRILNTALPLMVTLFMLAVAYSFVIDQQLANSANPNHIGTQVVVQYLLSFALMFLIWRLLVERDNYRSDKATVFILLSGGIAARLVLLAIEPYTSSDVSRYLFDGRVLLEGFDPYRTAHDASELRELREIWQPPSEHAKYATLYPPLALTLYSLSASVGVTYALLLWKVLTTFASILLCLITYSVLKHADRLRYLPLVALNPLLIFEAGEGAHVDVFSALVVMVAVRAWQQGNPRLLGIAIGLGASIKILPAILLIPFWFLLRSFKQRIILAVVAVSTWITVYGVAMIAGLRPVGSLQVFFSKWRASSPLFHWFEPMLGSSAMALLILSLAGLGLIALVLISAKSKAWNDSRIFILLQASLALPLLLSPVIFPWYLMPLVVLFALQPNWPIALWMISLPVSYEVLNQYIAYNNWAPSGDAINLIGMCLLTGLIVAITQRAVVRSEKA